MTETLLLIFIAIVVVGVLALKSQGYLRSDSADYFDDDEMGGTAVFGLSDSWEDDE